MSKGENSFCVSAIIKNKQGKECFSIEGKCTEELYAKNLLTGEKWVVFKAPTKPLNSEVMYNYNMWSLQLNVITDELKAKLPPTDSRLRTDIRHWDEANLQMAGREKDRLENNQRARRKQIKAMIKEDTAKKGWDTHDEPTFYNPKFFTKTSSKDKKGKLKYHYTPKMSEDQSEFLYWSMRDKKDWQAMPKLFEDNCEPFY